MDDPRSNARRRRARIILGTVGGSLIGLGVSTLTYVLVNPILERSSGLLRETQGILWSTIPILTALGAVLGRSMARKRSRDH